MFRNFKNWNILVKYFTKVLEESQDSKHKSVTKGFLKFLTDYEKLKLLCFVTDLGYLYSRFQKQLQADYVTIYNMIWKKRKMLSLSVSIILKTLLSWVVGKKL